MEEENSLLKRLVADLSLDKHMLSEALRVGCIDVGGALLLGGTSVIRSGGVAKAPQ
jgi:hypothetical protein